MNVFLFFFYYHFIIFKTTRPCYIFIVICFPFEISGTLTKPTGKQEMGNNLTSQ